jgi:uncharacterized phage protein (TIGR02220 family)
MEGIFKEGYGNIAKLVMKDKNLTIGAKAVYAYLCSYSGAGGIAYPSRSLICHDLKITQETLSKHLKNLEEQGYILREQQRSNGSFSHNIYTILTIPRKPDTKITDIEKIDIALDDIGKIETNNNSYNNNSINNNNKNTYIVERHENSNSEPEPKQHEQIPYQKIVEYLNEKTGKQYRHTTPKTRELIKARWNEGFTLDDFKKVIDNKTLEWKNTKWENYLRPVTLFSTKFESYLNDDPNIILRKKKEESKKEEYNIQEFFERLEIDYIIELTGNEYMAKKRFNEYAEKYGVDKDSQMLFKEFSSWCRKLRDGEKV